MLQDARVDIDFKRADELFDHYCGLRSAQGRFDAAEFSRAFAILGAQRATKILGIFARLSRRDGKPIYLSHIPRVWRYLKRNLEHPDLAVLKGWYERNFPP
jgi:aminoglycoside/choline kinase family phosphotransferase